MHRFNMLSLGKRFLKYRNLEREKKVVFLDISQFFLKPLADTEIRHRVAFALHCFHEKIEFKIRTLNKQSTPLAACTCSLKNQMDYAVQGGTDL